jgi:hypothetical protein
VADPTSYQGGSSFLRWWPVFLLLLALAAVSFGGVTGLGYKLT